MQLTPEAVVVLLRARDGRSTLFDEYAWCPAVARRRRVLIRGLQAHGYLAPGPLLTKKGADLLAKIEKSATR